MAADPHATQWGELTREQKMGFLSMKFIFAASRFFAWINSHAESVAKMTMVQNPPLHRGEEPQTDYKDRNVWSVAVYLGMVALRRYTFVAELQNFYEERVLVPRISVTQDHIIGIANSGGESDDNVFEVETLMRSTIAYVLDKATPLGTSTELHELPIHKILECVQAMGPGVPDEVSGSDPATDGIPLVNVLMRMKLTADVQRAGFNPQFGIDGIEFDPASLREKVLAPFSVVDKDLVLYVRFGFSDADANSSIGQFVQHVHEGEFYKLKLLYKTTVARYQRMHRQVSTSTTGSQAPDDAEILDFFNELITTNSDMIRRGNPLDEAEVMG